jgi:nitrite reductase/ring-hydroxylating ferredoxin subunit
VDDYVDVGAVDDLPEREPVGVEAHGYRVALFRVAGGVAALWSRCPHAGGPLDEGYVKDDVVLCPWHSSMFRVTTGERLDGPAETGAVVFPVEVVDGRVLVGPAPPGTEPPPPSLSSFFPPG